MTSIYTTGSTTTLPISNVTISNTTSSNYSYNYNGISGSGGVSVMTIPSSGDKVIIDKKAALEVKGKLVVNGRDMEERLSTIEKVLQIPERDVKLEAKYPKLKKMYQDYIDALGKYRTFEAIKNEDHDD